MLTTAQLATVKADIQADAVLTAKPLNSDGAFDIAAAYNLPAAAAFVVWRTLVSEHEITKDVSAEGTSWSWPAFIARTTNEQAGWARIMNGTYSTNPSLPNVRQGFADIFSGATSPAVAQRTHLLAACKRNTTRIERLLATGTGTTATPGTMTFEGPISYQEIERARAS